MTTQTSPLQSILALGVAAVIFAGCNRGDVQPPKEVSSTAAPKALAESFADAPPTARALAVDTGAAMAAQNYAQAYETASLLAAKEGLSKQQQQAAGATLVTINKRLAERAAQGDTAADAALKKYRATK